MYFQDKRTGLGGNLRWQREGILNVLLCKNGNAGSDPSYKGKRNGPAGGILFNLGQDRRGAILLEQLKSARLGGVALDKPMFLKGVEMSVNRRW